MQPKNELFSEFFGANQRFTGEIISLAPVRAAFPRSPNGVDKFPQWWPPEKEVRSTSSAFVTFRLPVPFDSQAAMSMS
jgi:hypothetical protein